MAGQYGLAQGSMLQQAAGANQQAQLQQQQMNDQAQQWGWGSLLGQYQTGAGRTFAGQQGAEDRELGNKQFGWGQMKDYAAMAGGLALMASDERVKENVEPGEGKLKELLEAAGTHAYTYKDSEKHGEGVRVSPMAQELEKSELGRALVHEDASGTKLVNYPAALGAMLASEAMHEKRIAKLEALLSKVA
jgi:hypothetical protein